MLVDQIRDVLKRLAATGNFRSEHVMHWAGEWIAGEDRTSEAARRALAHAQRAGEADLSKRIGEAYFVRDAILAAIYYAESVTLIEHVLAELK